MEMIGGTDDRRGTMEGSSGESRIMAIHDSRAVVLLGIVGLALGCAHRDAQQAAASRRILRDTEHEVSPTSEPSTSRSKLFTSAEDPSEDIPISAVAPDFASLGIQEPPASETHEYDGRTYTFSAVEAGWRPLVYLDRTHLDSHLEVEGAGGADLTYTSNTGGMDGGMISVTWLPMEADDGSGDVDVYWLDWGMGDGGAFPLRGTLEWTYCYALGPSFTFMDFDEESLDFIGGGAFARLGYGLRLWRRVGIEVGGDLHFWVGGDSDQIQAAWAASADIRLTFSF